MSRWPPTSPSPRREIAALFREKTGDEAILSFGASGPFFAQIAHDAPFEVFLSADAERPKAAVDEGYAVPGTEFTYANGRLVLWSKVVDVTNGGEALRAGRFSKLAIANPAAAPYGAAAIEALKALGVYDALQPKIVQGRASPKPSSSSIRKMPRSASSRSLNCSRPMRERAGSCHRASIRRSGRTQCS
jgi:molybdenum ABC transporter molybdate-binding protein